MTFTTLSFLRFTTAYFRYEEVMSVRLYAQQKDMYCTLLKRIIEAS